MTADRATSDRATSERPAAAATTVVVDPGEPPYRVPPVLEVRGPLTEGRVAAALGASEKPTPSPP
ncbi:hypothetical protein G6539_26770, partial [Streptomyces albidoflavus]|nr:hypothetical protein [Streptomyces albidoflavus]